MDTLTTDQARDFGCASGTAEAAREVIGTLRVNVAVLLSDEDFGPALEEELNAMRKRLGQIEGDLALLARTPHAEARYRLAHRGAELASAAADRAHREAIEARGRLPRAA